MGFLVFFSPCESLFWHIGMRCVYCWSCWAVRTCGFSLAWLWLARSPAFDSEVVLPDRLPAGVARGGDGEGDRTVLHPFTLLFRLPRSCLCLFLGTKLLMLQFRWCLKLKILSLSFSPAFSPTFTPSLYFQA